jgi:hypothetical protein
VSAENRKISRAKAASGRQMRRKNASTGQINFAFVVAGENERQKRKIVSPTLW